jgi:CHASE2 domain-containing sensor protein/predicted Ser/Thr protein kinase
MSILQPEDQLQNGRYRVIQALGAGGQGQTFEIEDAGTRKVLKVLIQESPKTIAYLRKEAEILSRLDHPGIPRIDPEDGYFLEAIPRQVAPLHCLVMEKIDGINLQQWMKQRHNQPITEAQAIDWLTQLVNILHEIHQNDFFHLDIKPSNLMLKRDENLVLIDFGISKEITNTYLAKLASSAEMTGWSTDGYAAPEVLERQPLPQSDFFSLGRTFIFLLTGQPLATLPRNQNNDIVWQQQAPQVSSKFAKLLDQLMERKPADRFLRTQELKDYLANQFANQSAKSAYPSANIDTPTRHWEPELQPPDPAQRINPQQSTSISTNSWFRLPDRRELGVALLTSLVCAIATVGIRYTGLLQTWELQTFDQMMRLRPDEPSDNKLLIVGLTYEDIKAYSPQQDIAIDDRTLEKLLGMLEQAQPRVIGLDLYRDFPAKDLQLKKRLRESKILYGICKVPTQKDPDGITKPNDIPQFGFADVLSEPDNPFAVRRHLLKLQASPKSCNEEYAFSVRVALDFLHSKGVALDLQKDFWQLGKTTLHFLEPHTGFYQTVDTQGYQILLNPRASKGQIDQVSLRDILEGKVEASVIQDRIVLIGRTSLSSNPDTGFIPGVSDAIVPGVMLQAEMVNQLVGAALGEKSRPILRFWALWQDALLIVGWAIVGGLTALVIRGWLPLGLATGIALGTLAGVSLIFLNGGILVPVTPSMLALVSAGGTSFLSCSHRVKANRVKTNRVKTNRVKTVYPSDT